MIDISVAWLFVKTWARQNHLLVAAGVCWTVAVLLAVVIYKYGQ